MVSASGRMYSRYVASQVKHNSWFLAGLALGLWVALALVPLDEEAAAVCERPAAAEVAGAAVAGADEWEPRREEKLLRAAGQPGRAVQRPRYYSTELGMRAPLLAGALSSEEALETRAAALNKTAARLQPALRFFITASVLQAAPGKANVVGFTDTREMLKPFHALKYLADNYLEEYDFFFLVSDTSYVNARRLNELVSKISVSQDVYMGTVAEDDTHYCTLEGGILLSNSVLRAVYGELDWCVRNSYSAHHHENLGRCVLHAAHLPCAALLQSESYTSVRVREAGGPVRLAPELARAVTAYPLDEPAHFHQIHAYVSRVQLEAAREAERAARAAAAGSWRRHPRGYRNATWPPALRADAGLAPAPPASRFDHLRWTLFNASHAFLPDDLRSVAPLAGATEQAVQMIMEESASWAREKWGAAARVVEGAWRWEPPTALRYRLLLALPPPAPAGAAPAPSPPAPARLVRVEAVRPLGAARLAPARYVTESARVTILLPVTPALAAQALAFVRRYEAACVQRDANTALVVSVVAAPPAPGDVAALRDAVRALAPRGRADLYELAANDTDEGDEGDGVGEGAEGGEGGEGEEWGAWRAWQAAARRALWHAAERLPRDALLLQLPPDAEFTEDFLNRVRMNTISGEQWYLGSPFWRFAHFAHPAFVEADGARPARGTGRFAPPPAPAALAVTQADLADARAQWVSRGGSARAVAATRQARARARAAAAAAAGAALPRPRAARRPRVPAARARRRLRAAQPGRAPHARQAAAAHAGHARLASADTRLAFRPNNKFNFILLFVFL